MARKSEVVVAVEQGLADKRGQRVILARNLLATLRNKELVQPDWNTAPSPTANASLASIAATSCSPAAAMPCSTTAWASPSFRGNPSSNNASGSVSWELGRQRGIAR